MRASNSERSGKIIEHMFLGGAITMKDIEYKYDVSYRTAARDFDYLRYMFPRIKEEMTDYGQIRIGFKKC
jgi:predicted DNA-binding transcriptional regulator YafY